MSRLLIAGLLSAVLAIPSGFGQPKPAAPKELTLPEGITKGSTVEGLTEYVLKNGLKVILLPDASSPKVTVNCTIFVGSRHEGYGETGMAHLLEHMVFKGCPKFPDVPKALRDHGANFNGTTSVDRTNYFETMTAGDENLEFGIELEADRMMNSFVKREDLMSEFTVVRNEFERGENSPVAILFQRMQSAAFEWHNYGKSTIGNRTDIEKVPIDSLKAFYKKFYRPDNAMLIVAGQFEPSKALGLIAKHFDPIVQPKDPIPPTYTEEPAQDGERNVTLRRVGDSGAAGVVYHIPAAAHEDYAVCEVLNSVLTTMPTGRLYKSLVETKKASQTGGFVRNSHDPSTISLLAFTETDKVEAARDALIETLESLSKTPITKGEVDRAVLTLTQQRERTLSNSQLFAISLSDWAACGDWRLFFLHRDRLEKVTADAVNKVAAKYMVRANRTVGVYLPTKQAERAAVPSTPGIDDLVKGYIGRDAVAAGEAFDPTPENVEKRVARGEIGGVKYAFLSKKTRGETVTAVLNLRFGNLDSLKGQSEVADCLGSMMLRGTKSKSREQLKDALDKLNAVVSVTASAGELTIGVQTKKANLPAVLALLKEVLREPSFPEAEFETLKREEIEGFEQTKSDPQTLATRALNRKLAPYAADDVRATPTMEELGARIKAVTLAQVKALYETQLGGQHGEIAIVGDFDPVAVKSGLENLLSKWEATTPYKRIEGKVFTVKSGIEKINTPDKANAVFAAGIPVNIKDGDEDYAAMRVGNYLLGQAPLASRLSVRVRGKDGLSYGVGSQFRADALDADARFTINAITNPTNMEKVDKAIAEEVARFVKDGVSASELEEGKKAFIQSQKVLLSSDGAIAGQLAEGLHVGRTFQYLADLEKKIESLQPGDVKKAFEKHVKPGELVIIQAGDFEKKK